MNKQIMAIIKEHKGDDNILCEKLNDHIGELTDKIIKNIEFRIKGVDVHLEEVRKGKDNESMEHLWRKHSGLALAIHEIEKVMKPEEYKRKRKLIADLGGEIE